MNGSLWFLSPKRLLPLLVVVSFIVGVTFGCAGCAGSGVRNLPNEDELNELARSEAEVMVVAFESEYLSDAESLENGNSVAAGDSSQASNYRDPSPFKFYLGAPASSYVVDENGQMNERTRMYPLFKEEELYGLVRIGRNADGSAFAERCVPERFAEIFALNQPGYFVSSKVWGSAALWVSQGGEVHPVGHDALEVGFEVAEEDWRDKMGVYASGVNWWNPAERTYIPFDYPRTLTDEELVESVVRAAKDMISAGRRSDGDWARAEGEDDFSLGDPIPSYWVTAEGEVRQDEDAEWPVFNGEELIGLITVSRVVDPRYDGGGCWVVPRGQFDNEWPFIEQGIPSCTVMVDEFGGFRRYAISESGDSHPVGRSYGDEGEGAAPSEATLSRILGKVEFSDPTVRIPFSVEG